jgi:hypothetical protein
VGTLQIIINDMSEELMTKLDTILERMSHLATQDDINTIAAQLNTLGAGLSTALTGIRDDIAAILAANPAVDLSTLQTSVDALSVLVDQATALDAENPVVPPV